MTDYDGKEININLIKQERRSKFVDISINQKELHTEGFDTAALTGLSDFFASICTTDVTILFYEFETGLSKASLRSKKTDVKTLVAPIGGGGHKNASGVSNNEPLEHLIKKVLNLILKNSSF